jgi:hypothetical protein
MISDVDVGSDRIGCTVNAYVGTDIIGTVSDLIKLSSNISIWVRVSIDSLENGLKFLNSRAHAFSHVRADLSVPVEELKVALRVLVNYIFSHQNESMESEASFCKAEKLGQVISFF